MNNVTLMTIEQAQQMFEQINQTNQVFAEALRNQQEHSETLLGMVKTLIDAVSNLQQIALTNDTEGAIGLALLAGAALQRASDLGLGASS